MKRSLTFLLAVLLVLGLTACGSSSTTPTTAPETKGEESKPSAETAQQQAPKSDEKVFIRIGTASLGGNFFPMGTALALAFEETIDNVKATGQATGGSSFNLTALDKKELEVGLSQSVAVASAINGTGSFEGAPLDSIATIANYHPTPSHIIIRKKANVKSFEDLKGKSLEMLAIGDGNEANAKKLLEALGIGWDEIKPVYSGNRVQAASALKTGKVDGIIDAAGLGSSWLVDVLGDGEDFDFIALTDEEIAKVTAKYPEFSKMNIPAATYKGQDQEIQAVANWTTINVRKDMDEELAYQITKAIFVNLDLLKERHDYFKSMSLETAPHDVVAPLHPGAEKYYKEVGALK
ncbi:TAXI family TRAP transporter solute-binding subunit [Ammoniphilus sp. CFH 90114]|uniref:TAXI family TRAP transporter solute-binding subunit n=1 Tax=Ammoniphilus sp. CFH 90114 TaxID=2493665 RepID=UPI0013E98F22|nr:TAXI family TRAP transporter solute-binding subunit [Ammoniphilus sp. CFH 90114]